MHAFDEGRQRGIWLAYQAKWVKTSAQILSRDLTGCEDARIAGLQARMKPSAPARARRRRTPSCSTARPQSTTSTVLSTCTWSTDTSTGRPR
eukprot:349583-Chlamydomonas_euryale.AAC.1